MKYRKNNKNIVMNVFKRNYPLSLGIDISGSSIKLTELKKRASDFELTSFAHVKLPTGAVVEKEIKNISEVAAVLETAMNIAKIDSKMAAIALADSSVITRLIKVPRHCSEIELEELVLSDAEENIPFPIDEIQLDYYLMEGINSSLEDTVYLAAAKRSTIDDYMSVLERVGLDVKLIDAESFAIYKACEFCVEGFLKDDLTMIVDIGSSRMTMVAYQNRIPIFSKTELFGSEFLVKDISTEEFEFVKPQRKEDAELYKAFKLNAIQKINMLWEIFSTTVGNYKDFKKVIFSGSAMSFENFAKEINDALEVEVVIANPITRLAIGNKVNMQQVMRHAKSLLPAIGLSLRGFDQ